jgi:hypothetical protein
MKIGQILKSSLRLVTFFVPQAALAKIASEVAIWAVESLVKNSKSKVDDKILDIVKTNVKK